MRPYHREAGSRGEAGSDTRRDLMQPCAIEAVIGQPVVERRQPERQCRPALALGLRELSAKRS